ncbi:MAG: hypothetical protein WCF30_09300 [Terracidiphilus sp.]
MFEDAIDHTLTSEEPGALELTPPQSDTAEAAPLNDAAGAEGKSAPAASDSPEAMAPSLIEHDAVGNLDVPEQTSDPNPSPAESGATEPTPSHEDLADAAASIDAAGPESQIARAASESLKATATSLVKHEVFESLDTPGQATDHDPSPLEPRTAEPTSPQEDTSDASARKDEAGAEGQVPAVPSKAPESNLPPTADGDVTQAAELDEIGWFDPIILQLPLPPVPKPAPKPKPKSFMPIIDEAIFGDDYLPTPSDTTEETEVPAPATDGSTSAAETAKPSEILTAPVQATLPPPRVATAAELITWIKRVLLAQTILPEDATELVAFWVLSTHVQDALSVLPCLLLTGHAPGAMVVLHVLRNVCREAKLLAGFRRSDLAVLSYSCKTNLISEPTLDRRTADLLGNLTDRNFMVVERGSLISCAHSTGIYAGANPETPKIQNSIHIHITPTNVGLPDPPQWLHKMMEGLPVHLDQYRNKNLGSVSRLTRVPSGLSSETAAIATALGRGIVNAPELRQKLVSLLQTEDQQRLAELSNTTEAVVLEATLELSRDGRELAYAHEIATAANRIQEARGERARLSPERVGHRLKGLGLPTCRLSRTGNGVRFDRTTVAQLQRLAAAYMVDMMEDTPAETENLHGSQATENTQF